MSELKQYFLRLIAVTAFSELLCSIFPPGTGKTLLRFTTGLLIVLTALRPLERLSSGDVAEFVSRELWTEAVSGAEIEPDSQTAMAAIIKEKTETYILNKGAELGMQLASVEAELSENGGYPIPSAVQLTGRYTAAQRSSLVKWIAEQLAIPENAQRWEWK